MDQDLSFYDEESCVFLKKSNSLGHYSVWPSQNLKHVLCRWATITFHNAAATNLKITYFFLWMWGGELLCEIENLDPMPHSIFRLEPKNTISTWAWASLSVSSVITKIAREKKSGLSLHPFAGKHDWKDKGKCSCSDQTWANVGRYIHNTLFVLLKRPGIYAWSM